MPREFFEGFEFKEVKPISEEIITIVEMPEIFGGKPIPESPDYKVVKLEDLYPLFDEITFIEPSVEPWRAKEVRREFVERLGQMGTLIGENLDMRKREIQFVRRQDLLPKTFKQRKALTRWYGRNYPAAVGTYTKYKNRNSLLSIGYLGYEQTASKEEVLSVIAHEYGHSLNPLDEQPLFEELKAYTFASLFMKHYHDVGLLIEEVSEVNGIHDKARSYLEQLITKGISEEAILAHLMNRNFGGATPTDYQKHN